MWNTNLPGSVSEPRSSNPFTGANATVESLDDLSPTDIAAMPIAVLAQLDAELSELEQKVKHRRCVLKNGLVEKYKDYTSPWRTTNIPDGEFSVKITTPKRVDWDQAKLAELWKSIGETANQYIKIKYDVSENAFKSWPEVIQKAFEPARMIRPGATTITIAGDKK